MDDPAVEPVQAADAEPVRPAPPVDPAAPSKSAAAAAASVSTDVVINPAAERQELEHPVTGMGDGERVAQVHDAAQHGDRIAAAIERAHTADSSDRAQQLGGAAASAASGQATPPEASAADDRAAEDEADPLAPIIEIGNDEPERKR